MAFSEEQRVQIRHYLGYPDVFQGQNTRLESAMDVIGERVQASARVVAILAEITAALAATAPSSEDSLHSSAGIKQVDEVHFFGNESVGNVALLEMRKLGRQWVNQLSIIFGVCIAHDIFGRGGYADDSWGSAANQMGFPLTLG
jgi:hypothetical protein